MEEKYYKRVLLSSYGDETLDRTILEAYRIMYNHANTLGLQGIKVRNLEFHDYKNDDPLSKRWYFSCESTEEISDET